MAYEYTVAPIENHTADRIFTLEQIDKEKPMSSTGLVDKRLFTGENKLHAIIEQDSSLWKMKYDSGNIPEQLRQRFTTFALLKKHAEDYFSKRNIKITEISK